MSLRERTIRLAYSRPEMRDHLLALLRTAAGPTKRSLLFLTDPGKAKRVHAFLRALSQYQRNSTNKGDLRDRYWDLEPETRKVFAASASALKGLWRGADSMNPFPVTSWTHNKGYASSFGYFVFPVTDLVSYSGSIDSNRVLKVIAGIKELEDYEIGDDEDEIILVDPVWRDMSDGEMRKTRRAD